MPESVERPAPVSATTRRPSSSRTASSTSTLTAAGYAAAPRRPGRLNRSRCGAGRTTGWAVRGRLRGPGLPGSPRGCVQNRLVTHRSVDTAQPDRHPTATSIDRPLAEELRALSRGGVRVRRRLHEDGPWAERGVERVGTEGPGVERPGHELPERVEVPVRRALGRVVVRRGVVDIRGEPHVVADPVSLQEGQDARDLALATQRCPWVALGEPLLVDRAVRHDEPERQVVREN